MSELWYPKATRMPAPSDGEGGSWTGGGRKGLLHTTEGKIAADTFAVYRDKGFWAHFTATFEGSRFQIWQHIPLDRACRALDNEPGGVQTNRANVVQIELVGFADEDLAARRGAEGQYVERWPAEYLAGIAAWMRWVEANFAVPRRSTVRFLRYPASAGADNPNRLGGAAWVAYAGWLGHQHAPEQRRGHGDPGLIDIATLLRGEEEDISIVDQQTKQYLDEQFKQVLGRVDRAVQRIGGRPNTAYNNDNEAFQNLAMAKEALAEAREARKDLKEIKDHLGIH